MVYFKQIQLFLNLFLVCSASYGIIPPYANRNLIYAQSVNIIYGNKILVNPVVTNGTLRAAPKHGSLCLAPRKGKL